LMLRGELPDREQAKLLEAALVASVDHGPQAPSISIARMATTCGLPVNGAMASAINVLDETQARAIAKFGGPTDSPSVLIVKRPGKIVAQFTGTVDGTIVAQAAHNAGAGS